MSTSILFVRHGESEGNLTGRFYDSPEIALTDAGRVQAVVAGKKLGDCSGRFSLQECTTIYCSPYRRAIETCTIALRECGLLERPIIVDSRIREREFSGLVGKLVNWDGRHNGKDDAISSEEYEGIWTYDSALSMQYGVESLPELESRLRDFLDEVSECHPDELIIVFSHGGCGRMLQAICKEWPEGGNFNKIRFLDNCEVAKLTY